MRDPCSLATIINRLTEEQLAGIKPDDLLTLLKGLRTLPAHPGIRAACARLKNAIFRHSSRRWTRQPTHRLH